jgi:hypothetical protein
MGSPVRARPPPWTARKDRRRSAQAQKATIHTDPAAASATGATSATDPTSAIRSPTARVLAAASCMPPATLPHPAGQGCAAADADEQAGDMGADVAVLMAPAPDRTLGSTCLARVRVGSDPRKAA